MNRETAASDRGIDLPRGVAPERMPKADATGLAPEKSAEQNPPALSSAPEGSLLCASPPHFYGEVSERRPWAFKRDDRPKGVPNSSALCCVRPTRDGHRET